jgi:hypothetical protein
MDHSRFAAPLLSSPPEQSNAFPAVPSWYVEALKTSGTDEWRHLYQCEFPTEPERIERPSHELGCAPGALPARPYLPHYAPKSRCFACGGEICADWRCTFCGRDNA